MSNDKGFDRRNFLQAAVAISAGSGDIGSEHTADPVKQPSKMPGEDATTADILVDHLIDWGVTHVFGMVGDGINPIIDALRRRQDRVNFIGVRHEEAAAFMACG